MHLYPKPGSWEEFEEILARLLEALLLDTAADRYGKQGNPQHGIDILARNRKAAKDTTKPEVWAVQAKRYDQPPAVTTAKKDLQKAIDHLCPDFFILATTSDRDSRLQDWAIQEERDRLNSEHPVRTEVWFWENICRKLEQYPHLREKYLKPYWDPGLPPLPILKKMKRDVLSIASRGAPCMRFKAGWKRRG